MPGECPVDIAKSERCNFWVAYANLCIENKVCPQRCLRRYLEPGVLDCPLERLKEEYWTPFLEALVEDRSLKHILLRNTSLQNQLLLEENKQIKRRRYPLFPLPAVLQPEYLSRLCTALSTNIVQNEILQSLCLEGLTFQPKHISLLTKALQKTSGLQHFSLAKSPVGDKGVETLCHNLRNLSSIRVLDLSNCNISIKGIKAVSTLIKFQAMRRHGEAWMESLRYYKPKLDGVLGITRISLNSNPGIGNTGAEYLADALADDMWIKAIDLQCCDIEEPGARCLAHILPKNYILEILDLRQNPLIAKETLERIVTLLKHNTEGKVCEYDWLPLQRKITLKPTSKHKGRSKSSTRPRCHFVTKQRSLSAGPQSREHKPKKTCPLQVRQNMRSEHVPKHATVASSVSVTETSSEQDQLESCSRLKREIERCHHNLHLEQEAKKKVEQRLTEVTLENKKLHERLKKISNLVGCTLVDDTTLATIQATFAKLQSFLKMLQNAGLQDVLKGSGIDKCFLGPQQTSLLQKEALQNLFVSNGKESEKVYKQNEYSDTNSAAVQIVHPTAHFQQQNEPQTRVERTVASIKRLVNAAVSKQDSSQSSYNKVGNTTEKNAVLHLKGTDELVDNDKPPVDDLFKYVTQHASLANQQLLPCDRQASEKSNPEALPDPNFPLATSKEDMFVKSVDSSHDQTSLKSRNEDSPDHNVDKSSEMVPHSEEQNSNSLNEDILSEKSYSNTFEPCSKAQTPSSATAVKSGTDSESIPEMLTGSDNDDF